MTNERVSAQQLQVWLHLNDGQGGPGAPDLNYAGT